MNLYDEWMECKQAEKDAADRRREIEDLLFADMQLPTKEGSQTVETKGYTIKVTQRFNRKIDTDMLEQIAAENNLEIHLGNLFRWKPDIDMRAWKSAPEHVTKYLSEAITTTSGRPSFSISNEE